jgi:predicted Rossmann-fold nucleotide-binding protein
LGQYHKPIIIFNQDRFYDSLLRFFDDMVTAEMMESGQLQAWQVVHKVEDILSAIGVAPVCVPDLRHYHG